MVLEFEQSCVRLHDIHDFSRPQTLNIVIRDCGYISCKTQLTVKYSAATAILGKLILDGVGTQDFAL